MRIPAILGLLVTFAVSCLPGIAAACEGGGLEVGHGVLQIVKPIGNAKDVILQNDGTLAVIIEKVEREPEGGLILVNGCEKVLLKTGQNCLILQDNPLDLLYTIVLD